MTLGSLKPKVGEFYKLDKVPTNKFLIKVTSPTMARVVINTYPDGLVGEIATDSWLDGSMGPWVKTFSFDDYKKSI